MANMLFANNCNTTLNGGITAIATSMIVTSATGFPVPTGSQYFYCTLADAATQTTIEIVKVTAVSGTTFTIVRGQDGTTGTIFASGAVVSLRLVRASLQDFPLLDEVNTFSTTQTFSVAPITSSLTGFIYGNGASAQTVATTAQALSLIGTLPVANGGTGLTSLTANYIPYGNGTSAFSSTSALQFNGSILGIGSAPSNWLANSNGVQFLNYGSIWNTNDPTIQVSVNGYFSAGSNWLYLSNGPATNYYQYNGFHIWRYAASGTAGNVISWAAAMQIGSTGGVSIGNTTDPGAGNLSVTGFASASSFRPTSSTVPTNGIYLPSANLLGFATNSTGQMYVDTNGRLLLGTTVEGQGGSDNQVVFKNNFQYQNGLCIASTNTSGTAFFQGFVYNGSTVGNIYSTGTTTTYTTSSDYRLKNVEGLITTSGSFIDALKPSYGTWKLDGSPFVGFIAHELQEVCASAVLGKKDAVNLDGSIKAQGIDASSPELIANMVAELQSLRARLKAANIA